MVTVLKAVKTNVTIKEISNPNLSNQVNMVYYFNILGLNDCGGWVINLLC